MSPGDVPNSGEKKFRARPFGEAESGDVRFDGRIQMGTCY